VGGVSGRAGAKAGGSNLSATDTNSFACRDGPRHPGLPEGGALRGASSERGPRSVRRPQRVSSRGGGRADDSGCPKGAEEGNAVSMRQPSVCTGRRHERSSHARTGRVLHSVLRPVHVDPHYAPRAQAPEVGRPLGYRGRVNPRKGEEPAPGSRRVDGARLAAHHRFRKGEGVMRRRKGRRSRSPSLRGLNEPGFGCPHVVVAAVAEVGRRRLVSNKLGKRAPKRAARVE
jgi:hypothetical protein